MLFVLPAPSAEYCAAVRGNGELILAHWPALARAVEAQGLPKRAAGGSSAAISLFYLDSISRNPYLSKNTKVRNQQMALLIKSLVAHKAYLWAEDSKAPKVMKAVGRYKEESADGFFGKVKLALKVAKDFSRFMDVLGDYGPLLNSDMAQGLRENFSFYREQVAEAASVFAAFDAKNDKNLFFRDGLVDFRYMAILIGRIGDFYAGYYSKKQNRAGKAMETFLNQCGTQGAGKLWFEDSQKDISCKNLFKDALDAYYEVPTYQLENEYTHHMETFEENREFANKMIFEEVGSGLDVLATTAIVKGDGASKYQRLKKEYTEHRGRVSEDFHVNFDQDLSYGYWGSARSLKQVQNQLPQLYPNDTKSKKFLPIENGMWFEALSTSPAEPGLANLQRIPLSPKISPYKVANKNYFSGIWPFKYLFLKVKPWYNEASPLNGVVPFREGIYSAGGWSDLHPILVLKAAGCKNTLYITRQNGETVFGQQVFIRLTGTTEQLPFWHEINQTNNRIGWTHLSEEAQATPWNRLYNLANPNSSFMRSVKEADYVHCTNWDDFDLFDDIANSHSAILDDSWKAPLFIKSESGEAIFAHGKDHFDYQGDGFPGCIP